jgi:hypothetical protein
MGCPSRRKVGWCHFTRRIKFVNTQEAALQRQRLARFSQLEAIQKELYELIQRIKEDDVNGPCGQGPFTGNTRESRKIRRIEIYFSKTRGGAEEVDKRMNLECLLLEAFDFGKELEAKARARLAIVIKEIEAL